MIFDLFCPSTGPGAKKKLCHFMSNSHSKFSRILSNGVGGDSMTDRQMDALTFGFLLGTYNVRRKTLGLEVSGKKIVSCFPYG